ncbi:hypothetical protein NIES2101_00315 [Calothrix sp. HK-06]|nr:hypothetical protein NIES2101_00315 [Calothrix sp. HK-06]
MRLSLADSVINTLEGLRHNLDYDSLSETVNLVLDAIKFNWDFKLNELDSVSQSWTPTVQKKQKVSIAQRHQSWLSSYGTQRGLNVQNAANLVLSEYFLGKKATVEQNKPVAVSPVQEPTKIEQKVIPVDKPKGATLMKGLKL